MKKLDDEIKQAIIKKAKGYVTSETVEEYQGDCGEMILTKKKVTKKHVPPDTQAVKMLLEMDEGKDLKTLSEEELKSEKIRLLRQLKELENEN